MKLTPNLKETTVQGIDMKCFLIGSSVMCFCPPHNFSDANFCPLNSGPLDLNRLKIIDDILNRLKCQNAYVKCQKHISEEPIRKHFISMS